MPVLTGAFPDPFFAFNRGAVVAHPCLTNMHWLDSELQRIIIPILTMSKRVYIPDMERDEIELPADRQEEPFPLQEKESLEPVAGSRDLSRRHFLRVFGAGAAATLPFLGARTDAAPPRSRDAVASRSGTGREAHTVGDPRKMLESAGFITIEPQLPGHEFHTWGLVTHNDFRYTRGRTSRECINTQPGDHRAVVPTRALGVGIIDYRQSAQAEGRR